MCGIYITFHTIHLLPELCKSLWKVLYVYKCKLPVSIETKLQTLLSPGMSILRTVFMDILLLSPQKPTASLVLQRAEALLWERAVHMTGISSLWVYHIPWWTLGAR